jgi:hypothetical protein
LAVVIGEVLEKLLIVGIADPGTRNCPFSLSLFLCVRMMEDSPHP